MSPKKPQIQCRTRRVNHRPVRQACQNQKQFVPKVPAEECYQKPLWRDIDFPRPVIVKTVEEQPSRAPTSQTPVPTKWTGRFSAPYGDDSDGNDDLPIKSDSNGFKATTSRSVTAATKSHPVHDVANKQPDVLSDVESGELPGPPTQAQLAEEFGSALPGMPTKAQLMQLEEAILSHKAEMWPTVGFEKMEGGVVDVAVVEAEVMDEVVGVPAEMMADFNEWRRGEGFG
ncbi:hypothetical protein HDU81_000601, partial [Chytriomyces hyalinus]